MSFVDENGVPKFPKLWDTEANERLYPWSVHVNGLTVINDDGGTYTFAPSELGRIRIIAKSFSDLVMEAKENPIENALTRATQGTKTQTQGENWIMVWLTDFTYIRIDRDFEMEPSEILPWNYAYTIDSLRVEGYPVGIPQAHIIHQSEIKQ